MLDNENGFSPRAIFSRLYDIRVLGILLQIGFVILVYIGASWFLSNTAENISRLGEAQFICRDGTSSLRCSFDFMSSDAGFDIAETALDYKTTDSYWYAIWIGALNTVKVVTLGIILATILGTLVGIARLSQNWLVRTVARWYVDLFRNTPLLLQLVFIYFAIFLNLPGIREAISFFDVVFISQRGINYPWFVFMPAFPVWFAFIVLGVIQAQVVWVLLKRQEEQTGAKYNRMGWAIFSFVTIVFIGWIAASKTVNTQAIMVHQSTRIREFDDIEAFAVGRFDAEELLDIQDIVALAEQPLPQDDNTYNENGYTRDQITAAQMQIDEGAIQICAIREAIEVENLTAQLNTLGIPYSVAYSNRADQATEDYAAGDCDIYVSTLARLGAEREQLENSAAQRLVSIPEVPVRISTPRIEGLNFVGGGKMTPEFAALLIGLVLNTAANIAEIVRAGIQSVPKGQTEAARALGLSEGQRLRLVILPQALRVIIPPQTSQYLNLAKNSSLALAIAYPDFWAVVNTTINQSGRSIQLIVIVMATYLSISISISLLLNWYNRRIALVER